MATRIHNRWQSIRSSRGQIIILVAVFAVALTAMVGLSIDLGYAFAQRRSVQNAADAGAMAGAHALTKWSLTNPLETASTDVATVVNANKMNAATTQTYTCNYIDDRGESQGACSQIVPTSATGVHVTVQETHSTFFIRVIPFAPHTVSTSASATSHVQGITTGTDFGSDSPFILCGAGADLAHGGNMNVIVNSSAPAQPENWSINTAAYGQSFVLHDSQVAGCDTHGNRFKGVSDKGNYGKDIPGLFDYDHGDRAGPTRTRVNGVNGCAAGTTVATANNCVLIVPIASGSVDDQLLVQTVGAFLVTQCRPSGNCHEGVLLKDYVVQPDGLGEWTGSHNWKPGDQALITIRLTN